MAAREPPKPLTPRPNTKSNVPTSSKGIAKKTSSLKTPGKPNTSILSFFKKVDSPLKDDSIFISHGAQAIFPTRQREMSEDSIDDRLGTLHGDGGVSRYNEDMASIKRRKISNETLPSGQVGGPEARDTEGNGAMEGTISSLSKPHKPRHTGPFMPDSDSESELSDISSLVGKFSPEKKLQDGRNGEVQPEIGGVMPAHHEASIKAKAVLSNLPRKVSISEAQAKWEALQPRSKEASDNEAAEASGSEYAGSPISKKKFPAPKSGPARIPMLKHEPTSVDDWGQFEDMEDFADDEFPDDGEEFVERKWMQEQAMLEDSEIKDEFQGFDDDPTESSKAEDGITEACPICSASLQGIDSDEATRHVNGCLDGSPIHLPQPIKEELSAPPKIKLMPEGSSNRFARKAAIARPGQANPFELGAERQAGPSTAFTALMSGKAEDAAWANAAAAENASRGKPAYERTCPFYKIMPGLFICVDAFRYGAVQGCNAYFLSHFHSDHYIGLTSTWCHGPIYCSKITANLVKQQLRVDPKWVVPLDFEVKTEVPSTQGVQITMISANHCPGSSLFLFEKVIGKGNNPKVQRILHCGDFRACPAHIAHPQLMPDIVDSITGKTKQQKIDVCYLDTTYLNPKYAFPSQEEVIKACADMCISLKKEKAEDSDAWEVVKRQRAGAGMTNFISNSSAIKSEDNSIAMEIGNTKARGRLLVVCGTYSIGKERICMGIAKALDCKIWAPPGKMRICAALEDPELMSRMTEDPKEAQIHMQMLMEIRAETLQEYLNYYKPHFSRIVGFRPSGWNYRPPNSRFIDSPSVSTILNSTNWRSTYSMSELIPQRGSTREASCFGVPYSEHSSFRELTMFVCALRIEKVIPTVNVGSAPGRAKMKAWIEKWMAERRKAGVIKIGKGEGEVRW